MEEPRPLKNNKKYSVATVYNIMNYRSVKLVWTVDAQSFPEQLSFLDMSFEGISTLLVLIDQMNYLFRKKSGNMEEVSFFLQNKMDNSSFADL